MHGKKTLNACAACLLPEYKNSGLEQVAMTAQVSLFPNFWEEYHSARSSLSLSCPLPPALPTPRHSSYVSPSSFACTCMANRDLQRDAERKTWESWRESRDKLFCGDLHDLVESVVLRELAKSVPRSAKKKKKLPCSDSLLPSSSSDTPAQTHTTPSPGRTTTPCWREQHQH